MVYQYFGQQYGRPQQPTEEWVQRLSDALNFFVMPGCAVKIWVAEEPVIVLKRADEFGQTDTQIYDLVKREKPVTPQPVQQAQAAPDLSGYITREEFERELRRIAGEKEEASV